MQQFSDFNLSDVTTFHLQAHAATYIDYNSVDDLKTILSKRNGIPFIHIGAGSNLLFTHDYDGLVLHSSMCGINIVDTKTDGTVLVEALSGTVWDDFVAWCVSNNLYGAENLSAIPGEVGASAIQNIGAYGVEAKDIIDSVTVLDTTTLTISTIPVERLDYGYRHSIFKTPEYAGRYIILSVIYRLSQHEHYTLTYGQLRQLADNGNLTLAGMRDHIIAIRASKLPDPAIMGNAGSFFKNPVISETLYLSLRQAHPDMPCYQLPGNMVKVPAGWLIENAGLKGHTIGDAMVYPKQCLVIVNRGNATSADVVSLSDMVIDTVKSKFGISLTPEVIFI